MKIVALFAAAAAVTGAALPAIAAPAHRSAEHASRSLAPVNWTKRVVVTADGGFLVGNPAAKAKLVEYGSLTCPYCQRTYLAIRQPLTARIATGQVSFEFRPLAVHSADPILHQLLRCAGPVRFLRFTDDFYADQPKLAAAYEAWADANPTIDPNADAATRIRMATQWGFIGFAATHGLTPARAKACLANTAGFAAQAREGDAANALGVRGTPTFLVNGKTVDSVEWAGLDAAIAAALTGA